MQMNERLILAVFTIPEMLVLFGLLLVDMWYKNKWLEKRKDELEKPPTLIPILLIFLSLIISLIFNYLMYEFYFSRYESEYMNIVLIANPIVVVFTMTIGVFGIKPQKVKF